MLCSPTFHRFIPMTSTRIQLKQLHQSNFKAALMASTMSLRILAANASRAPRNFHSSARAFVKVGDKIPSIEGLVEASPGNKVDLGEETKSGISTIIGVPAAFSPACSESHIPGYINHPKLKEAGKVFVVAVNDPFVTKAWGVSLDPTGSSGIRFLGDPTAKFTEALDLTFDGTAIFGGPRSKRYALQVKDGKVVSVHVEPDNTGLDISAAEKVL
ncbi:Redoxin-domain-containing protein [Amylocarpus encephaloides]|uniref:Redoxin-domain-containing protein n=1 Tax=Amylocarpus encephaloides TaxID=45428 RepID=A0A9P7YC62_9HELO|nr:Redoxin-domain-containing protein [Amylocarpus encephaloides]